MIETGLGPSTHLHRLVHIVVTMVTSLAVLLVVTMQRPLTIAKFEMVKTTLIHASLKLKLINSIFIWKTTPPPLKKNQKHTQTHSIRGQCPTLVPPPPIWLYSNLGYILGGCLLNSHTAVYLNSIPVNSNKYLFF